MSQTRAVKKAHISVAAPAIVHALPQPVVPQPSVAAQQRPVLLQKPQQSYLVWVAASLVAAVLLVTLNIVLVISTAQDAHKLAEVTVQKRNAERTVKVLERNAVALNSPQNLAAGAQALGMVQNTSPAYLRLSDGAILGSPTAVTEAAHGNTVSNEALAHLEGSGIAAAKAVQSPTPQASNSAPVAWDDLLPAPQTH